MSIYHDHCVVHHLGSILLLPGRCLWDHVRLSYQLSFLLVGCYTTPRQGNDCPGAGLITHIVLDSINYRRGHSGDKEAQDAPPSICVTMDYVSHGPSLAQPGRHMSQVESCPHSCLTSVSIALAVVQQMKTKKNISELINEKILLFSLSFLVFKCHSCRLFKLYSPKSLI